MDTQYPTTTVAEIMDHRRTVKATAQISPWLKRQLVIKNQQTGIPVSEALRRCIKLWVDGKLDDLLSNVGQVD